MTEREFPDFHDPKLKAALRRAVGAERAPLSLRTRVEEMLAAESPERPAMRISDRRRHSLMGLAAAAVILLCLGVAAWRFETDRKASVVAQAPSALPEAFAQALVATHDHCCSLPDHHVLKGVPDDDFRLMTQKLREQLGFPVLAATAGDGWTFYGASGRCMVGPARSAHLVFKQGDESLSIFSIAIASESWPDGPPPAEGDRFSNMQTGHAIVSWVHDGSVFSVVGHAPGGSLDLQGISPIADRLRVALGGETGDAGRETVALR
jgi:hypothetical protein